MELENHFRKFASKIEPAETHRNDASSGHTNLRERLEKDKEVSLNLLETFLSGSYRRHTAVKPIKDVDIFVVLSKEQDSARGTLVWLEKALKRVGYATKTEPQRRSIRVDLSYVTMDVVPALAPNGVDGVLKIPARQENIWIDSHPKKHIEHATNLNKQSQDERFIPTAKMAKWWRSYQMPKAKHPKGFLLECLCGKHMNLQSGSYAKAFISILEAISNAYSRTPASVPQIADPGLTGKFISTGMTAAEFKSFMDAVYACLPKAKAAMVANTIETSVTLWREVLGPEFPKSDDGGNEESVASSEPATLKLSPERVVCSEPVIVKSRPPKPWCPRQ